MKCVAVYENRWIPDYQLANQVKDFPESEEARKAVEENLKDFILGEYFIYDGLYINLSNAVVTHETNSDADNGKFYHSIIVDGQNFIMVYFIHYKMAKIKIWNFNR